MVWVLCWWGEEFELRKKEETRRKRKGFITEYILKSCVRDFGGFSFTVTFS